MHIWSKNMSDFHQELVNAYPLVSQLNELAYNLVYQDTSFLDFVDSICQQANVEYIEFRDKPSTIPSGIFVLRFKYKNINSEIEVHIFELVSNALPYTDYDLVGRISEKIDARKRELDVVLGNLDYQINQHLEKVAKITENH
jgi:hypothetical protein